LCRPAGSAPNVGQVRSARAAVQPLRADQAARARAAVAGRGQRPTEDRRPRSAKLRQAPTSRCGQRPRSTPMRSPATSSMVLLRSASTGPTFECPSWRPSRDRATPARYGHSCHHQPDGGRRPPAPSAANGRNPLTLPWPRSRLGPSKHYLSVLISCRGSSATVSIVISRWATPRTQRTIIAAPHGAPRCRYTLAATVRS
jgi:hypothetical protein